MWISDPARYGLCSLLCLATPAFAEKPLSAIDWLSQSVTTPVGLPVPPALVPPPEPGVSTGALPENITVQSIDGPSVDAVGLLPVSVTGLPRDLWGATPTADLVALLMAEQLDALPAIRRLIYTLLLAEVDPPIDSDARGQLFLARVDRLLDMGALDQAKAMLEQVGSDQPETFRRWFDVSLLLGDEDQACRTMRAMPNVAPTFPARIFCLNLGGDWNAAAVTLQTARALGYITAEEDALLSRFLDPELFEAEPPLPQPSRPSPLVWRMMEAIGQPMATNPLPLAFAQGDLRPTTGWKAQIEAAERLTRSGALPPNRLQGLYDNGKPAASGGVWDRVAAMQVFDRALQAGDVARLAEKLPVIWRQLAEVELETAFAELYGENLAKLPLAGSAGALAFRIGLLSPAYETVALARTPATSDEGFLIGLAKGDLAGATPPDGLGAAIRDGWQANALPPDYVALIEAGKLGEAILRATALITEGAKGNLGSISEGLAVLRAVGLEETARRTALELMLLERRG